jgi:broad specificity polyphosphatase/5'/3'-nucleotidase SurE
VRPDRHRYDEPLRIGYELAEDLEGFEPDSDTYVLRVMRQVSITPLSIDLTSRVDLSTIEKKLRVHKTD